MNKKGVAVLVYFMMGVLFFIIGLALAGVSTDVVNDDNVMGSSGLDCTNSSISNQDKATCRSVEIQFPVYVATIFGLAGMLLTRMLS